MTPELIQSIKKMDEFSKQVRFLSKNNINTEEELLNYEKSAYERINPLKVKEKIYGKSIKELKMMMKGKILKMKLLKFLKRLRHLLKK